MSSPENFSPQHLWYVRQQQGLTNKALAKKVGIDQSSLSNIELGRQNPSKKVLKRLQKVLGENFVDTWRTPPQKSRPQTKTYSFEKGHCYSIVDGGWKNKACDLISPISGWNCVFKYKGKEGIHHVFTEARGGWTRTYTDAQLIGKLIKEVSHEQQT